jgi:hypothetical protein
MDSKRLDVRPTPIDVVRGVRKPVELSRSRSPLRAFRFLRPQPVRVQLKDGEHCRFSTRLHWMSVARNLLTSAGVTVVSFIASWGFSIVASGIWQIQAIVWLAAMGHMARTGWRVLRWRADAVIVTNRRLLCMRGILTRRVTGWNLHLITNVDVEQSLCGQLLGYGTLRAESGGQHNLGARREFIYFLPDPDHMAGLLSGALR